MSRPIWLLAAAVAVLSLVVPTGRAADPTPGLAVPVSPVRQVQETDALPTPSQAPTPAAPTAPAAAPVTQASAPPAAAPSGASTSVNISGTPDAVSATGGPATGAAPVSTNAAQDIGSILGQSNAATGVELQRRNSISNDPRIRGLRSGQFTSLSDGAPFYPARLDLDTPVSKFDPSAVRNVVVIRGPYSSLLGPGFSFLDIGTLNSPRAKKGSSLDFGGSSSAGYQTNGSQWNGLQTVTAAGENWGFRGSYNILQGNAYKAGDGEKIPAQYLSHNFNIAVGYDLTDKLSVEFKALRTYQYGLDFPSLYFDIDRSDSEAYSLRLVAKDFGPFDQTTTDVWYNGTAASGSTTGSAKQAFVNNLLKYSFAESTATTVNGRLQDNAGYQFQDGSTTRFAERSVGYRLAGQVGNNKDQFTVTGGTDLNVFGQGLTENIRFQQLNGPGIATVGPSPPVTQTQTIPNSNSVDVGLFLQAMAPVNSRLKITAGGRADGVRDDLSGSRVIRGNADLFGFPRSPVTGAQRNILDPAIYSSDPRQVGTQRDFLLLSGFVTGEYKLTKETTLFLGYGYAERAPTLTELYAAGPFIGVLQQGTSRLIGDPNLARERNNQFDVGLRYDAQYLHAGISGFYSLINDYITYDANRVTGFGLSQLTYTNTDLATLAGTEMYVQADVTSWLSPFATLSYVQGIDQTHRDNRRGTVVRDANGQPLNSALASSRRDNAAQGVRAAETEPLPQIPPLETRLGFRVHGRDKNPRWQVEFSTRIVNGKNDVAASLGEQATPGFTTFDIRGYVRPLEFFTFSAGVENIGNKLYREHLDPIAANTLQATTATGAAVPVLYRPGTNFFFRSEVRY